MEFLCLWFCESFSCYWFGLFLIILDQISKSIKQNINQKNKFDSKNMQNDQQLEIKLKILKYDMLFKSLHQNCQIAKNYRINLHVDTQERVVLLKHNIGDLIKFNNAQYRDKIVKFHTVRYKTQNAKQMISLNKNQIQNHQMRQYLLMISFIILQIQHFQIFSNFFLMIRNLLNKCLFQASTIKSIRARQIYDSRGNPTVEADVVTQNGLFRAAVPSGASTGKYEALQLRDGDKKNYLGKGVSIAVNNVNTVLAQGLKGWDVTRQQQIDKLMVQKLDGTQNQYGWSKHKLGANAILAVSLAIARAGAASKNVPLYTHLRSLTKINTNKSQYILPCPSLNVINGGKHGGNGIAMQQFMILPTGAKNFSHAMQVGSEVYHHLMKIIKKKHGLNATNVGDEGGFAPNVPDGIQALQLLRQAIDQAGHSKIVQIGMDCAASQFWNESSKKYDLHFKDQKLSKSVPHVTNAELNAIYEQYAAKYPIVSIQDPFDQDDWQGWNMITKGLGSKIQIVGDDLLVTNKQRIETAIQQKSCNALLLKVNQIGSLTESIEAAQKSIDNGWGVMVSHRSGQTEDTFIADLVVGLGTGQIKTGAPCRSQRLAKYNQLLRIEQELGDKAIYAGKNFRYPYKLL